MNLHNLAWPALGVAAACTFEQPKDFPPEKVITVDICGVVEGSEGETDSDGTADSDTPEDTGDTEDACGNDSPPVSCSEISALSADGVGMAMLAIAFTCGSDAGTDVVLTTNLGMLDPTAEGAGRFTKTLKTPDAGPLIAYLHAGVDSGTAVVRATIGTVYNEAQIELTPATPGEIDIVGTVYVMSLNGATASDLNIYLYNTSAAKASVSVGLDVHLQACSKAGKIADVQRLVRTATPDTGLVKSKLSLNALGAAILNEVAGTKPAKEILRVYAYVPGESHEVIPEDASCTTVETALKSAVVYDYIDIDIMRKPM